MATITEKFSISTNGFDDVIDLTSKIQSIVSNLPERDGLAHIQVMSSTASIVTIEYEPGIVVDLPELLSNLVPINNVYKHDNSWHEGNAFAHLRASLLGNSVTMSVVDRKIELSSSQQIILIDFDNKPRKREIIVSVVY